MFKLGLFTCSIVLPFLAMASDQTTQTKPLPTEPLEEYDNPPAPFPLWGMGVSPGMISHARPLHESSG